MSTKVNRHSYDSLHLTRVVKQRLYGVVVTSIILVAVLLDMTDEDFVSYCETFSRT